ncbi:beta-ketoacyl-ACP synthase [Siccirubricoccus phaeus]|uniref:beta-ketoacyl-ACP synthase n=1 Tax=Siccirubricoccus phaeus TaxID=2595053 RepID=UPI0011F3D968|nr:beta-ketoacyl-ACP synthase [Siccirubricoccus phaeus]
MSQPVWITGIGLVTSLGEGLEANRPVLAGGAPVLEEAGFAPFPVHPLPPLNLDTQIPKKGDQRQMEPWQRLGTYAAGLAIESAAARGLVADMHLVVAAGGGERDIGLDEAIAAELARLPPEEAGPKLNERLASGLRPTLFLAQLSNLLAGNISIVHGVTGSSRTFMGEESAAADAVRIAAARLAEGRGGIALAGGAYVAGRWDMLLLYAASGVLHRGPWARLAERGEAGLVMGGAACFLVLETEAHARARGATGLAKLAGIVTNASRRHGADSAAASAAALAARLPLRPGAAVISGMSGAGAARAAEEEFLAGLPGHGPVVHTAETLGHSVEAAFPTNLALAAASVQAGAPQALVTGFGVWRGEALALVEPI